MSNKPEIRVRFAPSPTGFLHIGGLRTALFNWLFAKKNNGKFILRIEDTDRTRLVPASLDNIKNSLKWYGLEWDEGPDLGGPYKPYIQSARQELYQKHAQKLLESGKAYRCFCSSERLDQMRKDQQSRGVPPRYDRTCRKLSADEVDKKIEQGLLFTIRLKVPTQGKIVIKDLIRGKIEFDYQEIDDQVLLKSDGFPTYHLAVVVDDNLMKISHVIRGEEWLPSLPKHILLYQAFDWPLPQFAHLPMILAPDKSKLSKRHGAVSASQYKEEGYLAKTIINFIALLGWNPKTEQEVFSLEELTKEFSLDKVNKAGAVFDLKKLDWLNGHYLRELDADKFTKMCLPYLEKEGIETKDFDFVKRAVILEQSRIKKLSEIPEAVRFLFEEIKYESQLLTWKKMNQSEVKKSLQLSKQVLSEIEAASFNFATLEKLLKGIIEKEGLDTGALLWPLRVALSGRKASPSPFEIAEVLGQKTSLKRIEQAISLLK